MAAYATLTALKARLKITADDRDTALQSALDAASRQIDSWSGRRPNAFATASSASIRVYDLDGRVLASGRWTTLLVDEIGSTTDLAVETGDGTTWTSAAAPRTHPDSAIADGQPITGLIGLGAWLGADLVRVTARWGWPSTPEQIVMATLIQAHRLYSRKDSPDGTTAGAQDFGTVRLARMDPDVRELLSAFALPGIA